MINGPGSAAIVVDRVPALDEGDALIAPVHVALCGTDIKLIDGTVHDAVYPMVPGHEWVGVVESCQHRPDLVGATVVGSNFITCGMCEHCRAGRPAVCVKLDEIGFTLPGAMADHLIVPSRNLRVLPDEISIEDAPLLEPLCVALHAVDRAGVGADDVVVIGGGPVGLMIAQLCLPIARSVIVIERLESRRAVAAGLGLTADARISLETTGSIVFDVTGCADTFQTALDVVSTGGRVILVGYSGDERGEVQPALIMLKELDVLGVLSGVGQLEAAIEACRSGVVRLGPLISHRFPLERFEDAFDVARDPLSAAMRILVNIR